MTSPSTTVAIGPANFARRGWRSLHWFWLIPATLVAVVVGLSVIIGLLKFDQIRLKFSEPYHLASEQVRYGQTMIQSLGEPVEEATWLPDGQITTVDDRTDAWFDFDVIGPNGRANVYAVLEKQGEMWIITRIEVMLPGGQRQELDL